ncbi:hypothetical protein LCGC14_2037050, partial [marine sediment metagenome]
EFVAASGSLQSSIDSIDASVTLQEAYDNGDGVITTTAGKPLDLQGTGELTAVSGTFTGDVGIGTLAPTTELEVVGDITSKGTSWTSRTSAADLFWNDVAYGNGLFVAVSNSGVSNRIMTSPDGVNWTSRTSPADEAWRSVIYGNGIFVAVANSGTFPIMTSPDGITWTKRTGTANNNWFKVTYGKGLFVAVANSGGSDRVMTSPDGITWTSRAEAASKAWFSVTYGNGLFVAVAVGGTTQRVMTSPDGITWTAQDSAADSNWSDVAYGNGLFVAVARGAVVSETVQTSPDGITWTLRTGASDNDWQRVVYGNGLFVAISTDGSGDRVMTSPDGINWTSRTNAVENNWHGLTYGNGIFVAVSNTGSTDSVMTSGKIEINEVSTNNILQGGREIRGDLDVTGDVTISGSGSFDSDITAPTGTFADSLTVSGIPVDIAGITTDHGALNGLSDDDHTQYSLVDGTRAFTGRVTMDDALDIISSGIAIPTGSAGSPGLAFIGDHNSGLYQNTLDQVGITTGGTVRLTVTSNEIIVRQPVKMFRSTGATIPDFTSFTDTDTGMYFLGGDVLGLSAGGTKTVTISGLNDNTDGVGIVGNLTVTGTIAGARGEFDLLDVPDGTNSNPSIIFDGETDTGLYHPNAGQVAIATDGFQAVRFQKSSGEGLLVLSGRMGVNHAGTSVSEASIYNWVSADTGLYFPADNEVGITVNGVGRLVVSGTTPET